MSYKVAIKFPPRLVGGGKHKGDSRISKFDSNKGRGGGRIRGRGQGRGGRSGHHSGPDKHNRANVWFHGVGYSNFRRHLSGKEFYKDWRDRRLYVFNKRRSDKDTRHIQKVQQGRNDNGKDQALVPYSGEVNGNNKSGENGKPNDSKEHRAAQKKGGQTGSRFGRGLYKPT